MPTFTRAAASAEIWRHARGRIVIATLLLIYSAWTGAAQQFPALFSTGPLSFLFETVPWWAIALAALLLALWVTFEWGFQEVSELRRRAALVPRPNLIFERARPAFTTLQGDNPQSPILKAYLLRAEFRNVRRVEPPTCSLVKPHVRVSYYEGMEPNGELFALVRDGHFSEGPQRYEPLNERREVRSIAEVGLPEIRIGQSVAVDLLVRVDATNEVRTWSNEGASFGQRLFAAGRYTAVVEIEGENLDRTVREQFWIDVPDSTEAPELTYVSPQLTPGTSGDRQ